jgi:hypothetical protein
MHTCPYCHDDDFPHVYILEDHIEAYHAETERDAP